MVFARYIAFILSTYLGKFIKGLNKNSVNFSLLRGSFELKNVELATDLLSFSDHVQLESGKIGSLCVNIPWHSLYSRRCEVVIRDVSVVVAPKYTSAGSSTAFFKSKEEFLATVQATLAEEDSQENKSEKEPKNGFLHRLTQTVLKNLAFRLENITFRLEDSSGCWQGCTAGIQAQIGKLSCEATDSNFAPVFMKPEEQAKAVSIYRLISYEDVSLQLLHHIPATTGSSGPEAATLHDQRSSGAFADAQKPEAIMRSAQGVLTVAWESAQPLERPRPSLAATLVIRESSFDWSPQCITTAGILFESVRCAPRRAFAWNARPPVRPRLESSGAAARWWHYAAEKVIQSRRAARERNRFDWDAFVRRKNFLSSFLYFCFILLKAPWIPAGLETTVDEEQLRHTPVHDVMTCWNAARWYVQQYEKGKQPPEGTLYSQYVRYHSLAASGSVAEAQTTSKFSFAELDAEVVIECAQLSTKLDDDLRGHVAKTYLAVSKKLEDMHLHLAVASVVIVAEDEDDTPLFSIDGGDAGAMLTVSKVGDAPVRGSFTIESVSTCFDIFLQELLFAKAISYIGAAKPFIHQRDTKQRAQTAALLQSQDEDATAKPDQYAQFDVAVNAFAASADGVVLRIQAIDLRLRPGTPIVVKVREVTMAANDATIVQLCSIAIAPVFNKDVTTIEVATDSAALSTDVDGVEYIKLLLIETESRWKREIDNVVVASSAFFEAQAAGDAAETHAAKTPTELSLRFEFIECGALALDVFKIKATLADGWHIHLSAAGGTTEGWCHSVPPQPQDPFIDIDVWADAFLDKSPFAGSIEDNGIGFLFTLNHVTLCLGDDLAATLEALMDLIMLILFADEDRHVHLRNDTLFTIPHISGRLTGSNVKVLLESSGGDLTLLPGYAAAMENENTRKSFAIPAPPMPLTIELAGEDCIDLTLHRYGDKRMDIALTLDSGVNGFLRGTPAHIPLFSPREGMRAEIEFHLSAPSEADLAVFPYSRVAISVKLFEAAVVAHIPTIMALWTNFNTPSLPLGRVRNISNRVHYVSRPSRPGKSLPPRSPLSTDVEAIGAAALTRSSPFAKADPAAGSDETPASTFALPAPSAIYTLPVFPSDVTLRVDVVRSELYYTWGEGSVAPLFLHAVVPTCSIVVLNRDECVEVSVRGVMQMPHVAASFYRSPTPVAEQDNETGSDDGDAHLQAADAAGTSNRSGSSSGSTSSSSSSNSSHKSPAVLKKDRRSVNARESAACGVAVRSAFPDGEAEEGEVEEATCVDQVSLAAEGPRAESSAIQVHVTYTMDSRPPFRPGSSEDSLLVSLSGIPATGSSALPGPLYLCLRNSADVAAWLTFFTFFNPTNTVPLSSSSATVFYTAANTGGNADQETQPAHAPAGEAATPLSATATAAEAAAAAAASYGDASSGRRMTTLVRLAPVIFHLPFAGTAAALWDGVEFTASPGSNALRISQLEVLVHEQLKGGPGPLAAAGVSFETLQELRDGGFSVLTLRGNDDAGSRGGTAVPAVLLETHQNGPAAADVSRRLVVPTLQVQVSQQNTYVQLQSCNTLAAVGAVFAARSAQCALLNAVIQHESQRLGLQYACCANAPGSGTSAAAQLQPYLGNPMAMLFQNVCCTYEWDSGLQRDVKAGLTVALHNLRLNDYAAYNRARRQSDATASDYPFSTSMPFLVDVASTDAYVWWTSVDSDIVALMHQASAREDKSVTSSLPPSRLARGVDDTDDGTDDSERTSRSDRRAPAPPLPSSVGTCMPLLLHPVRVHTSLSCGDVPQQAQPQREVSAAANDAKSAGAGPAVHDGATASANQSFTTPRSSCGSHSGRQIPHAASTASFHTMPSTSDDTPATAAGSPMSPVSAADVAVAPVFEVSPVHVVLSMSAYVALSDALVHNKKQGAASGKKDVAEASASPPSGGGGGASAKITAPSVYTLTRREVQPVQRGGGTAPSETSSPLTLPGNGRDHAKPFARSQSESSRNSYRASERGAAPSNQVLCVYRFDAELQRTWLEKVSMEPRTSHGGAEARSTSSRPPPTADASAPVGVGVAGPQTAGVDDGVPFIPLSSVHAVDGLLPTEVNTQLLSELPTAASNGDHNLASAAAADAESDALDTPSSAPVESTGTPPLRLRRQPSTHVTIVAPCTAVADIAPRLQSRVSVTEVCVRLLLLQEADSAAVAVDETRDFWQRYTAVHTTARRAAITAESAAVAATSGADSDPAAVSVLTCLASTIPALRSLITGSAATSSLGSAWSRGSSAINPSRQRIASPEPAALLAESCVDALCVQLRGIVASSFTDARSFVVDACVCTSVKSPSRPLLAVTQVEVYVPTLRVTYPSLAAAARTVARDLDSATAATAAGQRRPGGGAAARSATDAASRGAASSSHPPPSSSSPPSNAATAAAALPGSTFDLRRSADASAAAAAAAASSASGPLPQSAPASLFGPSKATASAAHSKTGVAGRKVVMMGEVGCRLESISLDISATALRAWLSCLVEQPVAALRAAAEEKEKWVAMWGTRSPTSSPTGEGPDASPAAVDAAPLMEAVSLLRWKPGRGLRIYEARDPVWLLEHDITLSRDGLVLYFSNHNTNLMTVVLSGHTIQLDEALLLQPDGLQRTVMVIQSGLTVRFVGSGRVQLPLGMWNPSLWDNKGNTGVEAVLLPFMAIGEGSYLECVNVRLGFSEPTSDAVAPAVASPSPKQFETRMEDGGGGSRCPQQATTPVTPSLPKKAAFKQALAAPAAPPSHQPATAPRPSSAGVANTPANGGARAAVASPGHQSSEHQAPLTHRSIHLVLPCVSLILEPRQESRQLHVNTAVELWMSVCAGALLRDDLRCTGLTVSSESAFDAATTTARTTVLTPVDVSVCSNNGRHHAVSLGAAQVDMGRADLLLLSTYVGEMLAVRSYAKYLTHSRVEKEFLELVEGTLAWKAAAPVDILAQEHAGKEEEEEDESGEEEEGEETQPHDKNGVAADEKGASGDKRKDESSSRSSSSSVDDRGGGDGARAANSARRSAAPTPRDSRTSRRLAGESPRLAPNEPLAGGAQVGESALPLPLAAAKRQDGGAAPSGTIAALWDSVTSRRSAKAETNKESQQQQRGKSPTPPRQEQQEQQKEQEASPDKEAPQRTKSRKRRVQQHGHGFSWAVFTPAIELTISDHRYPLLQLCVQDLMLRRTSTSALASTSLARCQKASVRVYGRGRWDALLLPSAALTWSLTQSISRHSSNRHVLVNVEGIHVQCSHLIVAKLLYITRQLRLLSGSLQRRLAAASAVVTGERATPALVDLSVPVNLENEGVGWQYKVDHSSLAEEAKSSSSSSSGDSDRSPHHRSGHSSDKSSGSDGSTTSSSSDSGSSSDSDDEASRHTSADERQSESRRRRRVSAPLSHAAATTALPSDAAVVESLPSSRYTRAEAVMAAAHGTVPVSASMATHRLLNSFRYTLFAGICEREIVTRVPTTTTAQPGSGAVPVSPHFDATATATIDVPTIWRCRELYRLPPASATDIFVSYRRARSLVLTFFPVRYVEWDDDTCAWVLNAKGETDLAAKAVQATRPAPAGRKRSTTTTEAHRVDEEGMGIDHHHHSNGSSATNWFPFTTLQYGMARPVAVRTTTRVEVRRTPTTTSNTTISSPVMGGNDAATAGANGSSSCFSAGAEDGRAAAAAAARPRALAPAGGNDFSTYKVQTYALALTCVDPEEEAESLRYPIVIAPEEDEHASVEKSRRSTAINRAAVRGGLSPAASNSASSPLSRNTSSAYVDSVTGETAAAVGNGGAAPLAEGGRNTSGRSVDFSAHPSHTHLHPTSTHRSPPTSAPRAGASHHHRHLHPHSHAHSTAAPWRTRQSSTAGLPTSTVTSSASAHHHHPLRQHQQQPYPTTNAVPVAAAADDNGDGDLLVVRLQARSSLLNETGCTVQLRSLTSTASDTFTPTSDEEGDEAATAAAITVPPGWRLPLEEEDVQNEVLLRVCCPSARWVPTADAGPSGARADDDDDVSGPSGASGSAVFDGTSVNRWYEARLVLGDLDSGRFLSLTRVSHDGAGPSHGSGAGAAVPTAAVAEAGAFEDQDRRPLILFVVINYSSDGLIEHISLYPRLTLVNHLGVKARVAVFQQDPAAGPQTPDEAMLLAPWTAPYVGRGRHERERFHRSLVALGAHDALPHQHALPLHFCTYSSNLVLGLSFSQSTGDALFTADLEPVVTYLREAVDHHPRMLLLHDSHGRTFYVQVSVMPRTVVLSVALWVYNLTEYPLLLCDSIFTRRLSPGQSNTTGIIPSQGEPFLIGCRLADFTQGFFAIGLDGGWSGAVPIDVGSTGVFVSAQSRLGIQRSCNYSILFPNAQEGRPMVIQITPRWVFYNNTQKRLRLYFRFPGLAKAMREAEKTRRRLLIEAVDSDAATPATDPAAARSQKRDQILRQADDNVSTLSFLATVQLNPGEYHVSCVGPIEGNQFCVQDVLEGVLPSITSITKDNRVEHRDVAAYYESHLTPYMDVDRPGEATFNLWAAPRAPGKRMAVSCGGDLIVQRPVFPHPTWLEPYDAFATDAVITGRIAVEVQSTDNVLTVLLQPIQGTKILLQNRTVRDTVMVRQQGSRRRNRIPPRQNRFFLWEDARQEHMIRVHILGFKGRWFDVDFSAGECQVTYHVDSKAAAEAEALAAAQVRHPYPTHVKSDDVPHTPFSFFVRGYTNLEKTRVTIVVTESAIPLYASIDSWRTSAVLSLQTSMVQLSWMQEISAGVAAAAMHLHVPFGAAAAGVDGFAAEGGADANVVVSSPTARGPPSGDAEGEVVVVAASASASQSGSPRRSSPLARRLGRSASATRRRVRGVFGFAASLSASASASPQRSGDGTSFPDGSGSFTANPPLLSIMVEGLQLERISTEDTETFFFAIHQMQWIDEKMNTVFLYRARPRLPPTLNPAAGSAALSASHSTPSGSSSVRRQGQRRAAASPTALASPPSSASRRARAAMLLPRAAVAATTAANRVLDTVFGQSDAFLLAMEKANDVEFSYNFIKYADGVTRFTELRYVLTPLVVTLTDFLLVDIIQEVRRLRVLLGLRKQASTTQTTTTTVPMMMLTAAPLQQQQQQQETAVTFPKASTLRDEAATNSCLKSTSTTKDAEGSVVVAAAEAGRGSSLGRSVLNSLSPGAHRRTDSDVVIEAEEEEAERKGMSTAAVPPAVPRALSLPAVTVASAEDNAARSHPLQLPTALSASYRDNNSNSSSSSSSHDGNDGGASNSSARRHRYGVIRRSRRSTRELSESLSDTNSDTLSRHSRTARPTPRRATPPPPSSLSPSKTCVPADVTTEKRQLILTSPITAAPEAAAAAASTTSALSSTAGKPRHNSANRPRTRRVVSRSQPQPSPAQGNVNTTGFVSQGVFLVQLVQEVRARLQRQGTGLMAGSLAAVATTTTEGKRGRLGGLGLLRNAGGAGGGAGGGGVPRRQFPSSTVRHHRGAVQRGGAGDGLAGTAAAAAAAAADNEGFNNRNAGGDVSGGNGALTTNPNNNAATATAGGGGNGPNGTASATTTTAAAAANSNVNTAAFMFIERLEVHRITLYVTFKRHSPDPLRPILGAYAWMLPSQLTQREFYLPAWTLTRQVETAASLRARLVRWGMHSLREQWTKVTKLGTLLDALQFWQHRTLPLHGPPQTLTLARVLRQRQEQAGRPVPFAPCASSGEEDEDDEAAVMADSAYAEEVKRKEEHLAAGRSPANLAPMPPLSPQHSRS